MNEPKARKKKREAIVGGMLSLALAAFFTFMTPLHLVHLERAPDGQVSGRAVRCLLVVIPIRSYNLSGLDKVEQWVDSSSRSGSRRITLALWGGEKFQVEIPVASSSADETRDRIGSFLQGTGTAGLWEVMVPTWALGVIIPLIIASLGLRLTYMVLAGGRSLDQRRETAGSRPDAGEPGTGRATRSLQPPGMTRRDTPEDGLGGD
jgi:hypothetical protein